ncbi:hypothetical protein [Anaerorhabdus sp.]|uniref:hypothetical protein n=1 Tax=Anaerorhabdus sp. TaxID=1872524 RepID=UPI002FCBF224
MADVFKYLSLDGMIYLWAKILTMTDAKLLAKADNIALVGNELQLKSGANVLSRVTLNMGVVDYVGLSNKPTINNVELVGNKTLNDLGINIPTLLSQLVNDSNFQTDLQVNAKITSAIADITQFDFVKVDTLPETGVKGTIYLVPSMKTRSSGDEYYDEFIWLGKSEQTPTGYEKFGANIDLSGYVLKTSLVEITNAEIDAMVG